MKSSKAQIHARVHTLPELRFEDQKLTSYSGIVILQALFQKLDLKERLKKCFSHLAKGQIVGYHTISLMLIVHLMLGFRRLRDIDRYRDDPLVERALGLNRIPHVSTVCRVLQRMDRRCVSKLVELNRDLVLNRIEVERLSRVTMDFDGSVISSGRFAEGLAVGYNKEKKGKRSYYPLFCTVAQSAQVLDVLHRSGNVHDSNGAADFMRSCIHSVRERLPGAVLESRKDSAFFSDEIVSLLDAEGVQFTISVPFERFAGLKEIIETRRHWKKASHDWSYFELTWSPRCWDNEYRVLIIRHRVKVQNKEPIQLELFTPMVCGYDFKVIITNKTGSARNVLFFHNGRGTQESIFSELKSQCQMDYVPTRKLAGNQVYFLSAVLAHNLFRELEMSWQDPIRFSFWKRPALWLFSEAQTIRQNLLHRAGRLTRPQGRFCLTLSGNAKTREEYLKYLEPLQKSA